MWSDENMWVLGWSLVFLVGPVPIKYSPVVVASFQIRKPEKQLCKSGLLQYDYKEYVQR